MAERYIKKGLAAKFHIQLLSCLQPSFSRCGLSPKHQETHAEARYCAQCFPTIPFLPQASTVEAAMREPLQKGNANVHRRNQLPMARLKTLLVFVQRSRMCRAQCCPLIAWTCPCVTTAASPLRTSCNNAARPVPAKIPMRGLIQIAQIDCYMPARPHTP